MKNPSWLFGYGSLIWRPDFSFSQSLPASLPGWKRRFWQGSHDHRGTTRYPGRVVTLVQDKACSCGGLVFEIDEIEFESIFKRLDYREKNGYKKILATVELANGESVNAVTYLADENNEAWLGPASKEKIVQQIATAQGPSGANSDYLLKLAQALRELNVTDEHVFELERRFLHLSS